MKKYQVSANGTIFGVYAAEDDQGARDACAQDAGYADEKDMEARLEQESALVAVPVAEAIEMALPCGFWAQGTEADPDPAKLGLFRLDLNAEVMPDKTGRRRA